MLTGFRGPVDMRIFSIFGIVLYGTITTVYSAPEDRYPKVRTAYTFRLAEVRKQIRELKYGDAQLTLKGLLEEFPDNTEILIENAKVLLLTGKRDQALQLLVPIYRESQGSQQKILEEQCRILAGTFSKQADLDDYQVGIAAILQGRFRDAKNSMEALLSRDKNHPAGLLKIAQIDLIEGNLPAAIKSFEKIYSSYPFEPEAALWLGRGFYLSGRYQEAVPLLQAAVSRLPKSEMAPLWLSEAYSALQDKRKSIEVLDANLKRNPLQVSSLLALAKLKLKEQGTIRVSARQDLQLAISRLPEYAEKSAGIGFESVLGYRWMNTEQVRKEISELFKIADQQAQTNLSH